MADDGMIMNFDLGDAPLVTKQVFQGGRWKDRLAAKRSVQKRSTPRSKNPSEREIFKEKRHDVNMEEYIGPGGVPRPPKRQRVDDSEKNPNRVSLTSNKLTTGSEQAGGRRVSSFQEDKRSAFVAGKLPPGSINTGGKKAISFQDDTRPAFVSGKLPPGSINTGPKRDAPVQEETRPAFVSGKLPPGSINVGAKKTTKFEDDPRPAYVSSKLPPGNLGGENLIKLYPHFSRSIHPRRQNSKSQKRRQSQPNPQMHHLPKKWILLRHSACPEDWQLICRQRWT